jgi:ribose-phosphate pyrophosphokinase
MSATTPTLAQKRIAIIQTAANPELAAEITKILSARIGCAHNYVKIPTTEAQFANTETNIILRESVRGRDVYIITTGAAPVNDNLMALFLIVDACKRSSAHSVNVVMPAYPYARSDKRDHRGPIGSAMTATLLQCLGVDRLISCDIHSGQIQGFFQKAFDNLYCKNILIDKVREIAEPLLNSDDSHKMAEPILDTANSHKMADRFLLCSPDAGGLKRIKAWASSLGINYCSMDKQRDYTQMNVVLRSQFIGDREEVRGKYILIVDDIADTLGTMMASFAELKELGAAGVFIIITHGYFSGEAINRINGNDFIQGVICTDSLPQTGNIARCSKLHIVSIAPLLSEVIWRIQSVYDDGFGKTPLESSTSISKLFE